MINIVHRRVHIVLNVYSAIALFALSVLMSASGIAFVSLRVLGVETPRILAQHEVTRAMALDVASSCRKVVDECQRDLQRLTIRCQGKSEEK